MRHLFISHSSKDDLAAEAMRKYLVERGWNRKEIFLDFSVEGIAAHEKWKASLAEANAGANALLCLASPGWLASKESQVERRVAETLSLLDPQRSRAVLVAILRDLTRVELRANGFGEDQIVDLSAAGDSILIHAELPGRLGQPGRHDDVKFNAQALEKIERSLRLIGIAPESFEWKPRDPTRPSPYPGLEAFSENDAGVFFGRESRLADALGTIDGLRRGDGSRILTIIAASGVGKSSFLRAGLWPRLSRQSGVAPLVILRPGAGIISGREGGLIYALSDWFRRAGRSVAPGDLRAHFAGRSTREGLASVLTESAHAAGEGRTLILAIDQAEELFDASDETKATEAREFFDALLALLVAQPAAVDLLVSLTIRADGYNPLAAALARATDMAERSGAARPTALKETSLTLLPLPATAYRDIIRRPAQVALKTEREVFEPALVDYLLDSFTGADALPLLAKTLEQLYVEYAPRVPLQPITRADYDAFYGARAGALAPVQWALDEAYAIAGTAGTQETLKRLLIPGLVTWDPRAGEAGAARRRIATREILLDNDADLTGLADALASPRVRLLTRGRAEAGPTLEVAHEALLRVQPVKRWIEEFSVELRLRDEIECEASEWQRAETELATAREGPEAAKQLEALQRDIDTAIAARRGPRLEAAMRLVGNPVFAHLLGRKERAYLDACQARETEQIHKQRRVVGRAFVKPALQALEDGISEHALRLVAAGALLAGDLDLKLVPELWAPLVRAIFQNKTQAVLRGHTDEVLTAAVSPGGKRVVTTSRDETARLWNAETGTEIATFDAHADWIESAAFSPEWMRVVTASRGEPARLWDAETGKELAVLEARVWEVDRAAFSPDGKRLVTVSQEGQAHLWHAETGAEIAVLTDTGMVDTAAFSPDGTRVVINYYSNMARLWDAGTGKEIAALEKGSQVEKASFSPDGKRMVTTSLAEAARLWNAQTGTEIAVLMTDESPVRSAVFSPDSKRVVTACEDNTARLWDSETGTEIAALKGHERPVESAAFSPDGTLVVTASEDHTARLWHAEVRTEIAVLKADQWPVNSAAFSPDGKRVVTASHDATARLWDADTATQIALLRGNDGLVKSAAFSPDGKRVVTAYSNMARVANAENGTEIAVLRGHESHVESAAFSPDGMRVVTASQDGTARLWDAEKETEIAVLKAHDGLVLSAAFSPHGKRVVTASIDRTARLWDAGKGTEIAVLKGHNGPVWSAVFSPDGKRVMTASMDGTVRLWNAETQAEIAVLRAHEEQVYRAAFSPDGARVVTASMDRTARLWDAERGTEIAVFTAHNEQVHSAAFSPDGRRVVTASDDTTARLWDVSRTVAVAQGPALVLTAALGQGIGWRAVNERQDFLMQDAPDDMFSAALTLLGDRASALAETVAALHAPLHPNCYLSPTEFAAKFGLTSPRETDLGATT